MHNAGHVYNFVKLIDKQDDEGEALNEKIVGNEQNVQKRVEDGCFCSLEGGAR